MPRANNRADNVAGRNLICKLTRPLCLSSVTDGRKIGFDVTEKGSTLVGSSRTVPVLVLPPFAGRPLPSIRLHLFETDIFRHWKPFLPDVRRVLRPNALHLAARGDRARSASGETRVGQPGKCRARPPARSPVMTPREMAKFRGRGNSIARDGIALAGRYSPLKSDRVTPGRGKRRKTRSLARLAREPVRR